MRHQGDYPSATPTDRCVEARVAAPRWLQSVGSGAFGLLARLRAGRAVHARGVALAGVAQLSGLGVALGGSSGTDVLVRFSRGAGLPARLPDINGLAIRFVDAAGPGHHQDMLFAAAGPGPFRRVLTPSVDFATDRFSTLVRYRLHGEPVVLTAEVHGEGLTLHELDHCDAVDVELFAVRLHGRRDHIGSLHLTRRIDEAQLRFDPCGGPDVVPLGFLNSLRPRTYAASQQQLVESDRSTEPGQR